MKRFFDIVGLSHRGSPASELVHFRKRIKEEGMELKGLKRTQRFRGRSHSAKKVAKADRFAAH